MNYGRIQNFITYKYENFSSVSSSLLQPEIFHRGNDKAKKATLFDKLLVLNTYNKNYIITIERSLKKK